MIRYVPLVLISIFAGCNPFAPADDATGDESSVISDQKSIEGVFQNFRYAYTFKDTTIYGALISHDFIFTYTDYDREVPVDVSWGREEEMQATYGLFQNTQRLDLIWNQVVLLSEDSLSATVIRSFNLMVTFDPTRIDNAFGNVNLSLVKDPATEKWQIIRWIDESNF